MKRLFLIFVFLFFPSQLWGATYYVTQSGTGNGTTYALADSVADFEADVFGDLAGDTVYLCGMITVAVTIPDGGTSGNIVTIRGDDASHPGTVCGSTVVTGWAGPDGNGEYTVAFAAHQPECVWKDNVRVDRNDAGIGALTITQWGWAANVLYLGFDPSGFTIEADNNLSDLVIVNGEDYVTIDGLTVEETDGEGIWSGATAANNLTIQNCTIRRIGEEGVNMRAGTTFLIDSNTISDCGQDESASNGFGIKVSPAGGQTGNTGTISNNSIDTVINDDGMGIAVGGSEDSTVTISGNSVTNAYDDGIKTYRGAITIENNDVYSCGDAESAAGGNTGIQVYNGGDDVTATVRYNRVWDTRGAGLAVSGDGVHAISASMYYNIAWDNNLDTDNANPGGVGVNAQIKVYQAAGITVYNNVAYSGAVDGFAVENAACDNTVILKNNISAFNAALEWNIRDGTAPTLDYNCIYDTAGNMIYHTAHTYTTAQFAAYQAAKSQDANSISANPLFINAANSNFRLQATSPCRDAGTDISLTLDYAKRKVPLGSAQDIGAYEYMGKRRWWRFW